MNLRILVSLLFFLYLIQKPLGSSFFPMPFLYVAAFSFIGVLRLYILKYYYKQGSQETEE